MHFQESFTYSKCHYIIMYMYNIPLETVIGAEYIEPGHEISNNVVCATGKALDQPAHTRRLIRAFANRLNIL